MDAIALPSVNKAWSLRFATTSGIKRFLPVCELDLEMPETVRARIVVEIGYFHS
jgi:hypothetical protein